MNDCPWHAFPQSPAGFCEASLCAWIRQPANTWSNLGFLIVGFWILRIARKEGNRHLRGVGYISIVTGLGSAVFHATETLWGVFFDYYGMYLGASYMLSVNVRRWRGWERKSILWLFWGSFAFSMLVMLSHPQQMRSFYLAQALLAGCIECILFSSTIQSIRYRYLGAFYLVFLPAFALWLLDEQKIWCNPDIHWINGHAVWHLLSAVGLYFLYRFYAQFDALRFGKDRA